MVNIVWLDTNECSMSAWQTKDELLASEVCTIDSIGYLMADREDCVIIAGDKDLLNEDDLYGRTLHWSSLSDLYLYSSVRLNILARE